MRRLLVIAIIAMLLPLCTVSCDTEGYVDERTVSLQFSVDTVSFDTVFTTVATITQHVKVYNRSSNDIELSSVTLKHGRQSRFRLNVDGDTSMVARRVELQAGDSLFIFVQANINPNDENEPFISTDSIMFSNGQYLPLAAWGRNAEYHRIPADDDTSWFCRIDCANWRHDRPHVILDPAAVLDGNTLTLQPGDELHFADGAMLIIDSNATLIANGSADQPILFTSLRHDPWYRNMPGQWQTVWFYNYSIGNVINHAVVENAEGGLRCYPGSTLTVSNTVVRNCSDAGIIGQDASINGNNLLVYDCFSSAVLIGGGNYSFNACTFADYWNYRDHSRDTAAVIVSNIFPLSPTDYYGDHMHASFNDCIVYGTWTRGEVAVTQFEGLSMETSFTHSLIRGGAWDEDPMFTDPANDDYTLQEGSPATGIGYNFE
jgi:hypothetical protein